MKSIKSKILFVVISGLLVITAIVSAIAVSMTHEIMHRDADRILKNVSQKEAAYINDVLGDITKSATMMEHYIRHELQAAEQLQAEDFRNKYVEKVEKIFSEVALNTAGIEAFFLRLNPEYSTPTSGFYILIDKDNSLQKQPLTDFSKYTTDDTKNVGWYYTAVNAGEGVWMEPYFFPGLPQQLISYVHPLYLEDKLIGVLGFDMSFAYLTNYVDAISVYEKGYAVLLSADQSTCYNRADAQLQESDNLHTKATTALNNGMFLELRAEYKDIQRDIHPMLTKIVLAFIVVLFFSILYTVFVTNKIISPLKRLTASAESIALGTNSVEIESIPIESKDEIGTLSRVLTNAYAKIQEYTSYINALAYRDSLTGIKNSTAYIEAVAELNKEINCGNPQFGVLVVDINNLKQTNDTYGHEVGNELIVHTAKILSGTFKNSPVFRIGGDEFVVIFKNKDYENHHSLLAQMDASFSEDYISVYEDKIPVSIARGISLFDVNVNTVYEDVFSQADHAMYMHKEASKLAAK